jgi:hypothetical protein
MEQTAVEDRVELLAERAEVERVSHDEPDGEVPLDGLAPGDPDGGRRSVDAGGGKPETRGHQGMLAGTAADVEHSSADVARLRERDEGGLRVPDVPRRGATVGVVPGVHRLGHGPTIPRVLLVR